MSEYFPYILSMCIGLGLAAATGFRVFLPFFIVSLCSYLNWIPMQESWSWLGSLTALVLFGTAMVFEILAYYIPFIDNILDTIAVPLSAVAGTLLFSSQFSESNEVIKWGLGIIAGGGTAATISTGISGLRALSSTTTAGVGNPVVATVENAGATTMSALALILPIIAFTLVVIIIFLMIKFGKKLWQKLFLKKAETSSS